MKKILKIRWLIFAIWIAAVVLLGYFTPDLKQLATEKGQPKIPLDYRSCIGAKLLNEMKNEEGIRQSTLLVVFTSDNALADSQLKEIQRTVDELKSNQQKLHILEVRSYFDEDLKDEMLSEDGTTLLVQLDVDKTATGIDEIREGIRQQLSTSQVECYLTGSDLINSDMEATMHTGTQKTEVFTYILIFVILLLVFRSPVTPLISLFSIGLTYNCSLSIVTLLAEKFNIPYASTTQTFLILVLFGIGTDYNILLLMRFKEELKDKAVNEAIVATYRTAGKTVFLSSLTVLIGFAALFLARFSIYQAVSAVTIAVLILLLELTTLLPFFMRLLGARLFWPRKKGKGEQGNRLWEKVSALSVRKPVFFLMMILIITAPVILLYQSNLSYDNLHEVSGTYDSVKAIDLCTDKFGQGKIFPVNVLIKNSSPMDNNEALSQIDSISDALTGISGVGAVYSATRPKGDKLDNVYINEQTSQVDGSLEAIIEGVDQLNSGISTGSNQLPDSIDVSEIDQLMEGTDTLQDSLEQLSIGISRLESGMSGGAQGAENISQGITQIEAGTSLLQQSSGLLLKNYQKLNSGFQEIGQQYAAISSQIDGIVKAVDSISSYATALAHNYPEIVSDPAFVAITQTSSGLSSKLKLLKSGIETLNTNYQTALAAFDKADAGLEQITASQTELLAGITQLKNGSSQLADKLSECADGQNQVLDGMPGLIDGLQQVQDGQSRLKDGLMQFADTLPQLDDGFSQSSDALGQIKDGISSVKDYVSDLSADQSLHTFYIPPAQIHEDYQKSLDTYMSGDYKITELTVYLSVDPYSEEAIEVVERIQSTVETQLNTGALAGSSYGFSGVSSQNRDLSLVSGSDLTRSKLIMLVGIAIVLIFITRSLFIPVYIMASLIISYYSAYAAAQFIFGHLTGVGNLTWDVPFFSFIILIPLGVDYSIFLITRYRESKGSSRGLAAIRAASGTGTSIMSAAIILAANFAALYMSGITSYYELSTVVIIGLAELSFLFMPVFLPACLSLQDKVLELIKARLLDSH